MKAFRGLSDREIQVLQLAAEGHIDQSIANQLSVQVSTVRGYWLRIRAKWGLSSRSEMVAQFVRSTIIDERRDRDGAEDKGRQGVYTDTDGAIAAERAFVDDLLKRATKQDRRRLAEFRTQMDGEIDSSREAATSNRTAASNE